MTEYMYLYTPRGYSPGYVYRDFNMALAQLLKDDDYSSIEAYKEDLEAENWWHDFDLENEYVSIDDGARIEKIEVI